MATASLTADLLARKGRAQPSGKWLRSGSVMVPRATGGPKNITVEAKGPLVTKCVRVDKALNRRLKLLAARTDQSQQAIMEQAVRHFIASELEKADCICGAEVASIF